MIFKVQILITVPYGMIMWLSKETMPTQVELVKLGEKMVSLFQVHRLVQQKQVDTTTKSPLLILLVVQVQGMLLN